MQSQRLILASASPRRRDLLKQIGLRFDVLAANIDETRHIDEPPAEYVQRLAMEKALTILTMHPDAIVVGADTTVVLDGEVLNKPANEAEALRMLRALAGRVHRVHTGIAVVSRRGQQQHIETTDVFFSPIPDAELHYYLSTGDSLDKAGAYGIQGYAARWITRIEGDFFNVMGLPLSATVRLLRNC